MVLVAAPGIPARHQPAAALRDLIRSGEARRLRLAAGVRARTVAAALGISKSYFANIEAARRIPPPGSALEASYTRILRGLANHAQVSRELAAGERLRAG